MSIFTRAFQTLDGVFRGCFLGGTTGADGPAIPLHSVALDPDTPVDTAHPFPVRDVDRAALVALLDGVEGGLAGLATGAQMATLLGQTDGVETSLASILAKLIAAPATEAKQDVLIGHVDGVESLLTSLLAKVIAAPATEAKQDALKTSVDNLLAAIRPPQNHFSVSPGSSVLANATRRIVAGAAGTLTVEANGVSASYTVQAGQTIDIVAQKITAAPAGTVGQF